MKVRTVKPGFTLIELLVVIAIIALLLAVVMPALGKAKIYAQKVICSSNMRQQSLGVTLYANEHDSMVPIVQPDPANWFWDVSFWTTNQISKYAGFDDNAIFFCTANKLKKPDDARFWQYSITPSSTVPVGLQDESGFTIARQKTEFRVMPVLYMFEKLNSTGQSRLPTVLITKQKPQWISKLSDLKNTGAAVMLMDNVISTDDATNPNFFQVVGGSWTKYGEYDTTNHRSNKRNAVGYLPDGANIGYADGHVGWKHFSEMQHQLTLGPRFYW